MAAKYISDEEKCERQRREKESKEFIETSFFLYCNGEIGDDDLKQNKIYMSQNLFDITEELRNGVDLRLDKYDHLFEKIVAAINTMRMIDIEIERRSKSRLNSVDAVSTGSGLPGQAPVCVKSRGEASQ